MSIAVIIVNYGTADLAIGAVESVLDRDHGRQEVAVHLVDNAAPGRDAAILTAAHADRGWENRVKLWCETQNHGFGRGNNVVLNALSARDDPPDYVFLLNPDARLGNDALHLLVQALEAAPKAAGAGAGVVDGAGARGVSAFRFPGMISEVLRAADFGPLDRAFARFRVPLSADRAGGVVDWVSGAAVMFRFAPLRAVGFFDPDFFLYFEETELQHRLARAGWQVLFEPAAQVIHFEGAATGQFGAGAGRAVLPDYMYRSRWMCLAKTRGRAHALATALLVLPAAGFNVLHRGVRGRPPSLPRRFFRDHLRHGILPLLGGRGRP